MQTKDFKGQNLRGKSFKNQDVTGADFLDNFLHCLQQFWHVNLKRNFFFKLADT